MTSQERIDILKDIKSNISESFVKICKHHNVETEKLYSAEKNIENLFCWMIEFYKQDLLSDNTSKKALVLSMVNTLSALNVSIVTSWIHESPIEYLLFSALSVSMPPHIWERAYLQPQVHICNGRYILDIALMERKDSKKDGMEGIPVIGIECDGYEHHYNTPDKVTKTQEKIRNITMETGIYVFSYTGTEIYNNCTKLASKFWEYVESHIYPRNTQECDEAKSIN